MWLKMWHRDVANASSILASPSDTTLAELGLDGQVPRHRVEAIVEETLQAPQGEPAQDMREEERVLLSGKHVVYSGANSGPRSGRPLAKSLAPQRHDLEACAAP